MGGQLARYFGQLFQLVLGDVDGRRLERLLQRADDKGTPVARLPQVLEPCAQQFAEPRDIQVPVTDGPHLGLLAGERADRD